MEAADLKNLLIRKLNFYYSGDVHSVVDLSMREVTGDKGSLCGMSALYQAARQTILTVSQIKQMSFNDVKVLLGGEMFYDKTTAIKLSDYELISLYYDCQSRLPSIMLRMIFCIAGFCYQYDTEDSYYEGTTTMSPGRKRRSPGRTRGRESPGELLSGSERWRRDTGETEAELAMRSYGSVLRYQCGSARRFYDPELEVEYDERLMSCNWNTTWTRHDSLDSCIWTQCLYPPVPPPGTRLASTWSGDPVDFYGNVSFVCEEEELYFEWEREMEEFNVSCLHGGHWDTPDLWPVCLPSEYPPPLSLSLYCTE